jgi:glycosyltransferase involved in cell wall biosynthesis
MDVTVILATYQRPRLLARALAALLDQRVSRPVRWQLIVVDNNSRDETPQVVEAARQRSSVPVRYLFEPRQGQSQALNTGIGAAAGSIVAFTDDDCQPEANWIQEVLDGMERWQADGLGGRILPAWSHPAPGWLASHGHLWPTLALQDADTPRSVGLGPGEREHGFGIWGANMAFRRVVFDAVGGFHTGLGPQGSKPLRSAEPEFIRRLLAAGKRVVFDPRLVVRHHVGPERMVRSYFRRHRFYLGFGSALYAGLPAGPHLVGIPPYIVRMLAGDVARWLAGRLAGDREWFCRQLDLFENLGYLCGYVQTAWRARRYFAWPNGQPTR